MTQRDEFDDEGFLDSLLNRKGKTALPAGLRRVFILIGILIVFGALIAVVVSSWPKSDQSLDDAAVPIIRADKSPFKIKPENPGGMNVPNKDSTIFETLKGEKEVQPENLLEDDSDTAASVARDDAAPAAAPKDQNPADISIIDSLKQDSNTPETMKAETLKDETPKGETLKADTMKDETPKGEIVKAEIVKAEPIVNEPVTSEPVKQAPVKPAPVKTPPLEIASAQTTQVAKPASVAPVPAVKQAKAGGSTYIQLAAVKSETEAGQQWSKFKAKNPELSSLSMKVQKADLGEKGIFYRIQTGPLSAADAASTCSAIKSRGGTCIIVK